MREDLPYSFSVPKEWYKNCYIDKGAECSASRSFSICHSDNKEKAVLLVHGYAGYPGELISPAEALFLSGYDAFVPRLPGNGTTGDDFLSSSSSDWLTLCRNALDDLFRRYEKVSIVGHSMGGAICAILLNEYPQINRAVLTCPAIMVNGLDDKTISGLKLVTKLKKRIKQDWHSDSAYKMHYKNAPCDDEYLGKEYWSYMFPKEMIELSKIAKEAKESIKSITVATLVIRAGNDALVPHSAIEYIKENNSKIKIVTIENATHYIYYDKVDGTEEKAIEETVAFLNSNKSEI